MKMTKDYALIFLGVAFLLSSFIVPNGSNPVCQELWCKILVKSLFAGFGISMLWSGLKIDALPTKIFCRVFFGKKLYNEWCKEIQGVQGNPTITIRKK